MAIGNLTKNTVKTRYWWAICYPENMIKNWKEEIDDVLQLPYEYCVHDKDLVNDPDEQRKVHVHIIIAFPNTTTYKYACETFNRLSAEGKSCISSGKGAEAIVSIEYAHKYLIHNTEKCKREGKYQYSPEERISGNLFDIGAYIQLSRSEEDEIFNQIIDIIYMKCFESFVDVDRHFRYDFEYASEDDQKYYQKVLRGHFRYFETLCKGIHFKKEEFYKKGLNSAENRKRKIELDKDFSETMQEELMEMSKRAKENNNT